MASVFTRIIQGELPGRFVWRDERCVAFLSIQPLKPGHTLVVPIEEIDHWIDLPADLSRHVFDVAQRLAEAIQQAFRPKKVGLMIAGLEVPHVHVHLVPIDGLGDLDFARQDKHPDPAALDEAAERIRAALDG
jgi:histidine triad (HIT) family protein